MIDTVILYKSIHGGNRKISLRVLCRKFLNRIIQDSDNGHDSAEDARAAMELALLKVRHGRNILLQRCFYMILSMKVHFILKLVLEFGLFVELHQQ